MTANPIPGSPIARRAFAAALVLILASVWAMAAMAAISAGENGTTFTCRASSAQAVFLAGDFNSWNATAQPMQRADDGTWSVTVSLSPGEHEYKFVVDGVWQEDADNPRRRADPFGGSNSLVMVGSDGKPAQDVSPAPAVSRNETANAPGMVTVGAPRAVDDGVQFTYSAPGASRVTLAGSFNGWNAEQLPLTNDGGGNWSVVYKLPAGKHEYKFVADGSWIADPENPDTQADPYGGVNSLVNVDATGKLIATGSVADTSRPASNTALNPKVYMSGRYLTRFEFIKNLRTDPRFRLQRPSQQVDFNFETRVSDVTNTYARLRLDSDQNIFQNNVFGFLDEASLTVKPANFMLRAFLNQEVFAGTDLMRMGGDLDHPGTILHDHLAYGKGTAGAHFIADPVGLHVDAFFANVHNADYYNHPDLFDNTGEDRVGVRISRQLGALEIGVPLWAERWLIWWDFSTLVGLPSTGIPSLDEHRANTGDTSNWYEVENHVYNLGLDARYRAGEQWLLGVEGVTVDRQQGFVTGNRYGPNSSNGSMDVSILDRTQIRFQIEAAWTPRGGLDGRLRHIWDATNGGTGAEREFVLWFQPQAITPKIIRADIMPSPAVATLDSTELTINWNRDDRSLTLWVRRSSIDMDYAAVGRVAAGEQAPGSHRIESDYFAGRAGIGLPSRPWGKAELEWGLTRVDVGLDGLRGRTLECILRWDRDLTRSTGLIADLRWIDYHASATGYDDFDTDFFAPFLGVRYTPMKNLGLVAAWGVDPVDFSIAYDGRQMGRWWFRRNWLFDNPTATEIDAEQQLAKSRAITLRAQMQF